MPPLLPDLDSVNFARALSEWDLAGQRPHFPGYPVYVVLARAAAWLGVDEPWALSLPGAYLALPAILFLGVALHRRAGSFAALVGASILALSPLAVLAGGAPSSDGTGLAALAIAVAAGLVLEPSGGRLGGAMAGAAAGLALGARPSYALAVAGLLFVVPRARRRGWATGLAAAIAAWLLPLAAITGPTKLLRIGGHFLSGHASEWGGTVAVRPNLLERMQLLAFDLGPAGMGFPGEGALTAARLLVVLLIAVLLAALIVAWISRRLLGPAASVAKAALLIGVPYALWAFSMQNLLKARHALPLVLATALLAAAGAHALESKLPRRPLPAALALGLALCLAWVSWPLALEQGGTPSPAARLVRHVSASLPPDGVMLFTGEEARLFEHYAPHYRAARAKEAELGRHAERLSRAGIQVYVTSAAPGAPSLSERLVEVARFTSTPLVRSHGSELILYRFRRDG
ncbi:MAG: hypothetical protein HYZ28_14290 [Myxococcales bacterium]|nr:hypothetical protein [Myxococcales bacterium]